MKVLVEYMTQAYGNEKVKVFDAGFFGGLFNYPAAINWSEFRKKQLFFENVEEDMQVSSTKNRCIFIV